MDPHHHLHIHIDHSRQGTYFRLPFSVPENVERLHIVYRYDRRPAREHEAQFGQFIARVEANIIDLGVIDPSGKMVGASGSDKSEIFIAEYDATPGYSPCPIVAGQWQILVGAYQVMADGVDVDYEIRFIYKQIRLFMGDLHVHTLASDGVHTIDELGMKAFRNGLDFLAITDHNHMIPKPDLSSGVPVTMIPGVEWTHYLGHANFLGMENPYDALFATESIDDTLDLFKTAHERGALIIINHPFSEIASFQMDMMTLPFDCIEVWNGPMREDNLKAIGFWHNLCAGGKNIPITGGSDYHRDTPFLFLGGPSMGVYAASRGSMDILSAIRSGHTFITYAPNGPTINLSYGDGILGDSLKWRRNQALHIQVDHLLSGDVVRLVSAGATEVLLQAPEDGTAILEYAIKEPGFARIEVLRVFIPGVPRLPALISNPIHFIE